jgi:ABC-type nitrate/sulfonate/bicarbonate transport system permease component
MSTTIDAGRVTSVRTRRVIYGAASLGSLFVAWVLLTDVLGVIPSQLLPSPLTVVERFGTLLVDPFAGSTLLGHTLSSLERWGLGVLFAVILGVPFGVLLAWIPPLRAALTPAFELLRFIPPFAWVPIAVLWMGASTEAQAFVVFVAAFPPIVINSQLGVASVDPVLINATRTLGAGPLRTLVRVILPVSAPAIFTGVRIAVSNGWMALVGAELIVGKAGLGFLIAQGQFNGSVSTIFVGIIAIGLIGALIDALIGVALRHALPGRTDESSRK